MLLDQVKSSLVGCRGNSPSRCDTNTNPGSIVKVRRGERNSVEPDHYNGELGKIYLDRVRGTLREGFSAQPTVTVLGDTIQAKRYATEAPNILGPC